MKIDIPGRQTLEFQHIAIDYNGTIAVDGCLLPGVRERLEELAKQMHVMVLTADTFGTARAQCEDIGVSVETFPTGQAALDKKRIVEACEGGVVAIGNGYNDCLMMQSADFGIAILEGEGMFCGLLNCADVLVRSSNDAFDLLLHPDRLKATLRA